MAWPIAEIQTAEIARLRADTPLQGLLVGSTAPTWNIFDVMGVPTNRAFPYVAISQITSQLGGDLTFGDDFTDSWMQIAIFTQAGGFAQARAIAARIYALNQEKGLDLTASGYNQYLLLFENAQEVPQSDGITQLIAHRYKLSTQSPLG